jgi:hypothetical protein
MDYPKELLMRVSTFFVASISRAKSLGQRFSHHALLLLAIALVAIMKYKPVTSPVSNNTTTESVQQGTTNTGASPGAVYFRFSQYDRE